MSRSAHLRALLERLSNLTRSVSARNTASNFLALGWLSLLSVLTIPFYMRLLGVAEWGLVAACSSLQILSNFIDAGFSQIVPRWAAREAQQPVRLRQHIVMFQRLYIALGLAMFLVLQVFASYLAHQWFQVPNGRTDALELAIRIVSFQLLFQFVNNLYIGLWHGLQRQVLANVRACGFGTLKHAVALIALLVGAPQAWVYALAFACVAALEISINATSIGRTLGRVLPTAADHRIAYRALLKEVSVLSSGILVGLLVSQFDRIVLSRSVDVASFGVYSVISTLGLAFLQLQTPVTRAYFPVIVRDIQDHGSVTKAHMTKLLTGTLITCTAPALLAFTLAPQLLGLWLHNPSVVSIGTTPLRLLLLAVAFNSIYGCIYQVIVANGQSTRVLQFNLASLLSAASVVLFFGTGSGLVLGGIIWLSITLTQLTLGVIWYSKLYRHAI